MAMPHKRASPVKMATSFQHHQKQLIIVNVSNVSIRRHKRGDIKKAYITEYLTYKLLFVLFYIYVSNVSYLFYILYILYFLTSNYTVL